MRQVDLSVVVPVYNERDNVGALVAEIKEALRDFEFEMIFVDDASRDDTLAQLDQLQSQFPELRVLRHASQCGQSTAVRNGVKAARATWVATLDGDGQNDPADIPKLWQELKRAVPDVKLFAGWRTTRRDTALRRLSSRIANGVRGFMLKDQTPDSGCGLKLFERAMFMELPYFDHMHRFLPALVRRSGYQTLSVPVQHRPRTKGVSKYGVLNRLWVGIVDLWGVSWLLRRSRLSAVQEFDGPER
jgi:dolichol-phosphate mannosyltransferase